MGDEPDATTVQVQYDTYGALDKLKERGESFDDVIKRLIDNTAVGMDNLNRYEDAPMPEYGPIERIEDAPVDPSEHSCAHIDAITGEMCDNQVKYYQEYNFDGGNNGTFAYCEEHVPDHD